MKKEIWKDIWGKRGNNIKKFDPIKLNGWDTSTGTFSEEMVNQLISLIRDKLKLNKKSSLLEVGCGAGMIFIPLSKIVGKISGFDYSESLIRRLKEYNEDYDLKVAEANKIPFKNNSFDKIISHGVFQYFPSLKYAEGVISEMVRVMKPNGSILIMDINDIDKKEDYIQYRKSFGEKNYEPSKLNHLYYKKSFFKKQAINYNFTVEIFERNIRGYLSNEYRFNVLFNTIE